MVELNENELRELRLLACNNRGTKEIETFESSLFYDLQHHDFIKLPIISVSMPKRTLIRFAQYANDWDDDSLGLKLKDELTNRTRPKPLNRKD